jgi:two-component system chemotaxis sensor kinase CheA
MSELHSDAASAAAGIDLSQFYQVFFEEAGENLDNMEQMLLHVDLEHAEDEDLNAIFRCAHSVKGGAATFGFKDIAELTHQMETLLDKLRRRELAPTSAMVDVLLQSGDALRAMLGRHQGNGGDPVDTTALLFDIRAMAEGGPMAAAPWAAASAPLAPAAPVVPAAVIQTPGVTAPVAAETAGAAAPGARWLELTVGPLENLSRAEGLVELFKEIEGLGTIEPLDAGQAADGMRRFKVHTSSSDNDLYDLFGFHVSREQVRLDALGPGYGFHPGAPGAPPEDASTAQAHAPAAPAPSVASAPAAQDDGYGFFDGAPGAPSASPVEAAGDGQAAAAGNEAGAPSASGAEASAAHGDSAAHAGAIDSASPSGQAAPSAQATKSAAPSRPDKPAATPAHADSNTLRVSVDKVDQLINLVGELVITQAMLAQNSKGVDAALHQQLAAGLADLERNTRDLQEAVMSIRMIPMSLVFNRFPRMLRDLAAKLGKKVEMVQVGEATELDKGLVEKITDPLTHLVRNSCDHGIESPEQRVARGKPEHGTITLIASHQGGSIVIEVRDDGRGMNRQKLLAKARERGIDAPDTMTDSEVWSLIFAPGFSTADVVTDVSGRGVGMDVVKRNITSLGGTVEIDAAEGYGMTVRVRLPLTLAIMDGMSVGVGEECYILPLASVVESFQVTQETIKTIGGSGRVVEVRGEYMPVIELEQVFAVPRYGQDQGPPIMVVVEAEGGRAALLVDELLGQQQVVVKNLESNYRKVQDVSGATIMGDGRVALILDIAALVRRSRH